MGKLFNLKDWVTIPEATRYLTTICDEDVTEADLLRLALDGKLSLSMNFVNHATARKGTVVRYTQQQIDSAIDSRIYPTDLRWSNIGAALTAQKNGVPLEDDQELMVVSLLVARDHYWTHDDAISTIHGVWDLPMIGGDRLDIEHKYQLLTGGPDVTLSNLDGTFVGNINGVLCQLQESMDDNPYSGGSKAQLEDIEKRIIDDEIPDELAVYMRSAHADNRKKYLAHRKEKPQSDYYPAGRLPDDGVLVVRTSALRAFEQSINSIIDAERAGLSAVYQGARHTTKLIETLDAARIKFWANYDESDPTTAPTNEQVEGWLTAQNVSGRIASAMATILRADGLPTGRRE